MKLGYVGNAFSSTGCKPDKNIRLSSYNREKLLSTVKSNLTCIKKTLQFNQENHLLFYRIADFIPFASHPVSLPLEEILDFFQHELQNIGAYIRKHDLRISMHPGQYTIINSPKEEVVNKSIQELLYDTLVLDRMGLDTTAKVQLHVGGVYGDKTAAMERFVKNYLRLPDNIQKRLVIENDDRLFDLQNCLTIHKEIDIPVVFDVFHHSIKNNNETVVQALQLAQETWTETKDGILMLDWSSNQPNAKLGRHANSIDLNRFRAFIQSTKAMNFDIMLEIRDKEQSALKAIRVLLDNE
ncbi:MAG: UV DNA damage repair endonuclease UvsE [Candidatus Heimdallarchaeota archaeon]|nr:MAG: UV DNA damage repair endonuclease UvsE [Candidatus Heimdallarchaeota archaeon]